MHILIYTKSDCPYCVKTKQFLRDKNLNYNEKVIGVDITSEKFTRTIQATVPAIFIDDNFIGGYDQLMMINTVAPEILNG